MVKNRFKMTDVSNRKPNCEKMIVMKGNDCLNIGLPVGVLSPEDTYTCSFENSRAFNPGSHLRVYDVDKYNTNWEMGHFFVVKDDKLPKKVTLLKDIAALHRMRVDFFKGETLFEALVRDKRFVEKELRSCGAKCDERNLPLSYEAEGYQGKSIQIYSMRKKDIDLPELIPPLLNPHADVKNVKLEQSEIQEMCSTTAGISRMAPLASSTPAVKTSKSSRSQMPRDKFAALITSFITSALQIKGNEQIRKSTKAELDRLTKECDLKLKNFATEQGCSTTVSQLKKVIRIAESVGAVFILNDVTLYPELVGTCFRTGTQFIITNNHVWEMMKTKGGVFVHFNFEQGELPSKENRKNVGLLVVSSEELDYAILRMEDPPSELAPCIFSHGASIMDPNHFEWSSLESQHLTLIGHPNQHPKQTDLLCPVITEPLDSLEIYGHALRRRSAKGVAEKACLDSKDPRRGTYHVSGFFEGSSGSPGIVFQNGKEHLVILHTRGFYHLGDHTRTAIEQGVFLTEIYKDVQKRIMNCQQDHNSPLKDINLADIFPSVDQMETESMDFDQ